MTRAESYQPGAGPAGASPAGRGAFASKTLSATAWLALLTVVPGGAQAHSFVQPYTLPVPLSLYAWGSAAALVLSFAFVGLLSTAPAGLHAAPVPVAALARGAGLGLRAARWLSLGLLALCIAAGLFGTQNAFANFSMTFFWIVFVLGVPYAVALVGDFYAAVNPWRMLVDQVERLTGIGFDGRWRHPPGLGCYPALLLYMVFIWLELFGDLTPRGLAIALGLYSLVNVAGAWALGRRDWFRHGEFFALFMHLMGRMSPRARPWDPEQAGAGTGPRWRAPFVGLLEQRAGHVSVLVFILFMLSSTAFDGLHATLPWATVFWKGIYPYLAPLFSPAPGATFTLSAQLYYLWQWASLLVSPLVYLAVFTAFLWAMKRVTGSSLTLHELALRFAMSLVPIAFVYHVSHYYTLLLAQGGQIGRLVSDPFGAGWNLFGTAGLGIRPLMIDVEAIWHTQVALILLGHIAGVYLAHLEALQTFSTPRRAALSQLPMLVLMVLFTTLGLWILSLPIAPA